MALKNFIRVSNLLLIFLALLICASVQAEDPQALYQKGLKAFYAGQYDEAEAAFATVYRLQPDARYAPDAAFKAGESAFRAGRYAAAAGHFDHYLRAYPMGNAAIEAKERYAQAREKAGAETLPLPDVRRDAPRPLIAWLDVITASDNAALDHQMSQLARLGYNTVAVDAYRLPGSQPYGFVKDPHGSAGAYFSTTAAPVYADVFSRIVIAAHKSGLQIAALLPTRQLAEDWKAAARDKRWEPLTQKIMDYPGRLDLFDDANRQKICTLARDLARQGPDAIWLDRDLTYLPDEGLVDAALAQASASLGQALKPTNIFRDLAPNAAGRIMTGGTNPEYTALCEARAARIKDLVLAVAQAVKEVHPSCRVGAALVAEAAIDPIEGLRDFSLDLDALNQAPIEQVVFAVDWRQWKMARNLTGPEAYASMNRLSARALEIAGRPERAVVALRVNAPGAMRLLPDWEIAEVLKALLAAGPLGLAFYPEAPATPIALLLAGAGETERKPSK